MIKQISSIFVSVLILITVVGCAGTDKGGREPADGNENTTEETTFAEEVRTYRQDRKMTFAEALEESACTVIGKFESYEQKEDYAEYIFKVSEVLRGEVAEDVIHLFSPIGKAEVLEDGRTYEIGTDIYTKDEEYVLVMAKKDTLFTEYTHYGFYTGIYIPLQDPSKSMMQGAPLAEVADLDAEGIKNLIQRTRTANNVSGKNYTTATDLPTIVSESDIVLAGKITGLVFESEYDNCNTYYCDVQQILKGGPVNTSEERGDIQVTLTKESVEIGETYVLLLNRIDETAIIYTQSSLGSVIPSGDTETISEIQRLIEG